MHYESSIALKIFELRILIEALQICIDQMKNCQQMWNLWTKNMNGVTDKVEILHTRQTDPALWKK